MLGHFCLMTSYKLLVPFFILTKKALLFGLTGFFWFLCFIGVLRML